MVLTRTGSSTVEFETEHYHSSEPDNENSGNESLAKHNEEHLITIVM